MDSEKGEPLIDNPPQSEPIESGDTFCDAAWDDPQTPDSVRAAGCTVIDELKLMEATTK